MNTPTSERLRDQALDTHEQQKRFVLRRARRLLVALVLAVGRGTIEDIVDRFVDDHLDPRYRGAIVRPFVRSGALVEAGRMKTRRPQAHAREIKIWGVGDRAALERWLAENPEPTPIAPPAPATQQLLFAVAVEVH